MDEKIRKIILDKNVKVEVVDGETLVYINGKTQKLNEIPIDISDRIKHLNFCAFCGAPSGDYPLFTLDKKTFICRDCVVKAYNTFIENNVPMPINAKVTKS